MAIGTNWAEVWKPVWGPVWSSAAPVEVPDVVGATQGDATATIEGAGFVVAVVLASSSTVSAGEVISQSPLAGALALPGATVTLTVSSGPAAEGNQGNIRSDRTEWWPDWERSRKEERRKRERIEAEAEALRATEAEVAKERQAVEAAKTERTQRKAKARLQQAERDREEQAIRHALVVEQLRDLIAEGVQHEQEVQRAIDAQRLAEEDAICLLLLATRGA